MKKRYIYSAVLSAILFILLYAILDFPVLICVPLAVVTYVGGIFFFKEKDVRKYDPNIIMHYCYLISKIDNYANLVKDKKVKDNIKDISTKAEKIVVMLEQKPNKVTQVYDAFDYFLPLAIKFLEQYVTLQKQEKLSKEEEKFVNDINETLDYLEIEIDKMLTNMNYTKMLDMNATIEVFKKHNDGLEAKIDGKESENNNV
jgi:hypothetical protein